jgi:hypothetical protein
LNPSSFVELSCHVSFISVDDNTSALKLLGAEGFVTSSTGMQDTSNKEIAKIIK